MQVPNEPPAANVIRRASACTLIALVSSSCATRPAPESPPALVAVQTVPAPPDRVPRADAAPDATTPAPAPAPPTLDVRSPDSALSFLTAVCAHAKAGDAAWLSAHVDGFLPGNVWVNENGGDPLLGSRIGDEGPDAVRRTPLCASPPARADQLGGFVFDGRRASARAVLDGKAHRVGFEQAESGPRLVELSFELPRYVKPAKKAKRRNVIVQGRVLEETPGDGRWVLAAVLGALQRDASCSDEHASRSEQSGAFRVALLKEDDHGLELRVYASTVVPASWVACLEQQLSSELGQLLRGKAFRVTCHVNLGIPTTKRAGDADVIELKASP